MSGTSKTGANYYGDLRTEREKVKDEDISEIEAAYGVGLGELQNNRVQQRQEAAINNELLMKYLPQLNKANGLAGLGVSQSANVDALSRYQTNLGNIEDTYQRGKTSLDEIRASSISEVERAYDTDIATINANERSENNNKVTNATTQIGSGIFTTEDDLKNYITGLGFTKDSEEYNTLLNYGKAVINDKERTAATDEENRKKDEAKVLIEYGVFDSVDDLKQYLTNAGFEDTDATNDVYDELLNYGSQFINEEDNEEDNENTFGENTATYQALNIDLPEFSKMMNLNTPGSNVYVTAGNNSYILESQGVADESVQTATEEVKNGTVFMLNNGIYVKQNGIVYALRGKGANYNTADYTALFNFLNNTEPPTQDATQQYNSNGVDANTDYTRRNTGTTNSVISYPDKIDPGSEITYLDKNGKETKGKVWWYGRVSTEDKERLEGKVFYDESTGDVFAVLGGNKWQIES